MKRKLTITFELDDGPWVCRETGATYPTDIVAYAMDIINSTVPYAAGEGFVEAKLDDALLVTAAGYASDEVKCRKTQYERFIQTIV